MKTRRFEYVGGGSSKFWQIALEGAKHTVTFGRLGTPGRAQGKSFGTADAAKTDAEKLVAEKLRKGYREARTAAASALARGRKPAPTRTASASLGWDSIKTKVAQAFVKLSCAGIVAKSNFTSTMSDGVTEIHDAGKKGYAFFHSQDAARARRGDSLMVAFGAMAAKPKRTELLSIGRAVRAALEAEGLDVAWPEDPNVRLDVRGSKAARGQAERAQRAEAEKADKMRAKLRSQIDPPALEKRAVEVLEAMDERLTVVPRLTWNARKKALEAQAKKNRKPVAVPPSFDPDALNDKGEGTTFLWGFTQYKDAFALARRIKAAFMKAGFRKVRVEAGMVHIKPR